MYSSISILQQVYLTKDNPFTMTAPIWPGNKVTARKIRVGVVDERSVTPCTGITRLKFCLSHSTQVAFFCENKDGKLVSFLALPMKHTYDFVDELVKCIQEEVSVYFHHNLKQALPQYWYHNLKQALKQCHQHMI